MGRLIDEDELISILGFENTQEEREENVGEIITLEDIDRITTAYDPDKVVEQLEKEKQTSTSAKAEAIIGMCGASANHYGGEECAYQRAIEIVKGGGIDGN